MTAAQQAPRFTFEEFLEYEDAYGNPFELSADGWLIPMPAPDQRHELIVNYLDRTLSTEIERLKLNWLPSRRPIEIPVGGFKRGRRPDLAVIDLDPERDGDRAIYHVPHMIIEIASSNWSDDLRQKTQDYALLKVPEYWVIDYRGQIPEEYCGRGKGIKTIVHTLRTAPAFGYDKQEFIGNEVIPCKTFETLQLTTNQIVQLGKNQ
ncbi:Uma2 family endonuclease [Cyanobacteria bacterium FACHB-502]|nr:Uma2 family endonuclease [Cyanobacteria bacterium FACHB-502]